MRIVSSGGVELAVHDLGGRGPTLLISHATGFHGRCYIPMADSLGEHYHCIAFDYRGHGDTAHPAEDVDWNRYGDDAEAMAATLDPPIVGFGHSMGGACLLMAAHRNPGLFRALVVYEPIVFPPAGIRPEGTPSPLSAGARRRRASFPSFTAAIENYAAKPPLGSFTPEALDAYVRHGFRAGDDGEVHLKCRPEIEAATFDTGGGHDTWDHLGEIETPVLVISGRPEELQPSMIARPVAELLRNGQYLERSDLDHFGPMTHPALVAELAATFLADR